MPKFRIVPQRSEFAVDGRSSIHPLHASTNKLEGYLEFTQRPDNQLDLSVPPHGHLEVDVTGLKSGNKLYDLEAQRRADTRRYPKITVELQEVREIDPLRLYHVVGELNYPGYTRRLEGDISVSFTNQGTLEASGTKDMDSRDFGLAPPNLVGLKVYSDFRARLRVVAEQADGDK